MSDSGDGFDPAFRERLVAQWNRGPCVFRNVLRAPMFTDHDFMAALLGTAREYIANPATKVPPGRVYLSGEAVKPDQLAPLFPRGSAESLEQYVARIRRAYPTDAVGIVLDNCEKHLPSMRDRLVPALHHLFSQVGYPARRNHLCVYAGNYRSTPFGIHRDDCHVVMFCGVGRKSMAFWPRPYFDQKRELFVAGKLRADLKDHIAEATILEIGPLDALYWSADDWHVAVSDTDDFHAALSVGIYHQGSVGELMASLDFIAEVQRIDDLDIPSLPASSNGTLAVDALRAAPMSVFFDDWERLREVVSRPGEVEYRALALALRYITSAGYGKLRTAPPVLPPTLAGLVLSCPVPESLAVAHARGGLLVGANGSTLVYPAASAAIEQAVLALRDGRPHRSDDVVASVGAADGDQMTTVLRDLITAGALSIRPESESSGPA